MKKRINPESRLTSIFQSFTSTNEVYFYLLLIVIIGILSTYFHCLSSYFSYYAYTDIEPFHDVAIEPGWPYIDKLIEYPVLTGLFIQLTGTVGQTLVDYYLFSSFLLILCACITTYFLYRTVQSDNVQSANSRTNILIYWVLAPSMFFFIVYNWDMFALMFVVIAVYFMNRSKDNKASFFLALGFCSKFFPAIYLLPLLLNGRAIKDKMKIIVIFTGISLLINLPFMLINFDGWYHFYSFNSERLPNPDSIWAFIQRLFPSLTVTQINLASFLLLGMSSLLIVWRLRQKSKVQLLMILTVLFLLFNKVFSPQYLLWLLPFYVLLPMRNRYLFYGLELSNLVVLFTILSYLFGSSGSSSMYLDTCHIFVVIRHIFLLLLLLSLIGGLSRILSITGYITKGR